MDGSSADASVAIAQAAGLLVVRHETPGRAAAINRGVQEATAPVICVLHADTLLPDDAVAVMRRVLADPGTALAGFTPLLSGPDRVRWGPASTTGSRPGARHCCSGRAVGMCQMTDAALSEAQGYYRPGSPSAFHSHQPRSLNPAGWLDFL